MTWLPPRATLLALGLAVLLPATARADGAVGAGIGHSTRFGSALYRGELDIGLNEDWELVPNLEYVRADELRRFVSSLDVHYKLPWRFVGGKLYGYLGAGLGVITDDPVGPDASTTWDGQVNFLGGIAYDAAVIPFVQARSDARKVNWVVGLRLPLP